MKDVLSMIPINKESEMIHQENFYTMVNPPRSDVQERAIDFLCESGSHKVLSLNTNAGKTYITINAISKMKSNAIILVDTISLGEQ
jgi:superfamily II DNA or RNA helicase